MNKSYIFAALFFLACATFSVNAQDWIVLTNGDMIEAKVLEISPAEIRYRSFDNLDGPVIVIPAASVLSIRYENGKVDIINSSAPAQNGTPAKSQEPIMDPNKFYVGISAEPAGFLANGPSLSADLTKGKFNSQIYLCFPTLILNSPSTGFGFGMGLGLNYFWHSRIGGIYLGGLIEYSMYPYKYWETKTVSYFSTSDYSYTTEDVSGWNDGKIHNIAFGLTAGYKFVTASGMYFRTGVSAGAKWKSFVEANGKPFSFYYRPDAAIGYAF